MASQRKSSYEFTVYFEGIGEAWTFTALSKEDGLRKAHEAVVHGKRANPLLALRSVYAGNHRIYPVRRCPRLRHVQPI